MANTTSSENPIPIIAAHVKQNEFSDPERQVVIALRLERAADAIDVSVPYLCKAIREGRIKATHKKQRGKGRGVTLITVAELFRLASTDEELD